MRDQDLKILAIDDRPEDVATLRAVLADTFREAVFLAAHSGADGIAIAGTEDPDVILLDMAMPGWDGAEVCRRLKADEKLRRIPVVLLTGASTEKVSRIQALDLGAEAFLATPVDEIELTATVRTVARMRAAERRVRSEPVRLAATVEKHTHTLTRELQERRKVEEALRQANARLELDQLAVLNVVEDRRRADVALRESEAHFREVFDNSAHGIFVVDVTENGDFRVAQLNKAQEELAEVASRTVRGKSLEDAFALETAQHLRTHYSRCVASGVPLAYEQRLDLGRGTAWFHTSLAPVRNASGRVHRIVGSTLEITDRKEAEGEASRLREKLHDTDRLAHAGVIASALAHELNQPLSGILSNAQAARRLLSRGNPDLDEIREIVGDIIEDDRRAGDVIHRLRSLLAKEEEHREIVDVHAVAEKVVRLVRPDLVFRGAELALDLSGESVVASADPIQIQQVIMNLLVNALQAVADRQAGMRRITLSVAGGRAAEVVVSVRDTGPGIPADRLQWILEPFHSTKSGGMGMGLAIARSIVEAHGGRIWAESELGCGTIVSFTLPLVGRPGPEPPGGN